MPPSYLSVCIQQDVYFKWKEDAPDWILKGVNINVDMDARIAVCGVNGSGKSTVCLSIYDIIIY